MAACIVQMQRPGVFLLFQKKENVTVNQDQEALTCTEYRQIRNKWMANWHDTRPTSHRLYQCSKPKQAAMHAHLVLRLVTDYPGNCLVFQFILLITHFLLSYLLSKLSFRRLLPVIFQQKRKLTLGAWPILIAVLILQHPH